MLTPSEIPPTVIAPPFALSTLPRRGWRAGGPRGTPRAPPATPAAHPRAPARCSGSHAPGSGASARQARRRGPQPPGGYHFRAGQGLVPAAADRAGALAGRSLLSLARESLSSARALGDARRVLQAALGECLEGRPLATRAVAKSIARKAAR